MNVNSKESKHCEGELLNALLAEGQQRRDFSLEIKRFMSAEVVHWLRGRKVEWL